MELLVAHDDLETRRSLASVASCAGDLDVVECDDGHEVLARLLAPDAPALALVDGDLPGIDGVELCRLAREASEGTPSYIILIADDSRSAAQALDAGASDCVRTSACADELRARVAVGRRFAALLAEQRAKPATLVAERSPDGDDDDGSCAARFELESVLVVQ
jgi:CheY-like chemotaxis protein